MVEPGRLSIPGDGGQDGGRSSCEPAGSGDTPSTLRLGDLAPVKIQ